MSPASRPRPQRRLILASTSRYRRDLLARLGLKFDVEAPDAEELALDGEDGVQPSTRLPLPASPIR